MSETDLYFLERLQRRRDELRELIAQGEDAARPVQLDQSAVGRLSRMDAIQSQAIGLEAQRRRQLDLIRVGTALDRLKRGDFGQCVTCGEDISRARLDHDPAIPTCIDCARNT